MRPVVFAVGYYRFFLVFLIISAVTKIVLSHRWRHPMMNNNVTVTAEYYKNNDEYQLC